MTSAFLPKNRQQGFTLLEAIVGAAVFAIIAVAFYLSINIVVDASEISRRSTVATNLANQQLETLRNLAYSSLGTVNGNPSGSILPTQTITVDNIDYTIDTYISYVDDPYDGTFPTDLYSADYKRARIEVSWTNLPCPRPAILISDFSATTVETGSGTGVMQVLVKDANTLPIANAQVTITRADPAVHIEGRTNASGELIEPLLSPSNNDYHPLATKSGYSTDYTSPATAQLPDPYNPDVSITEGLLTQATLYIDLLSTLNIQTRDAATGNAVASLPLKITGLRKILGDDAQDLPVYKYDQVHATNDQGNLALSNMEWDVYSFALANGAETLYSVAGFDYPNQAPDPVTSLAIDPASITTLTIYLDTFTANNLLFTIRNDTQQLQGEADIHLVKNSGGYDEHRTTTAFGQAFFRDLTAGSYTYAITKTGYVTQTGEIDVTGQLQPEITLVPQT